MNTLATICTYQFVHTDRLAKWHESMSDYLGKTPDYVRRLETINFEPLGDRPFEGSLEYGALGSLHFCRMVCSPNRFSRSLSKPLPPSETPWLLILQMKEVSHFCQGGKSIKLTPGEILLLDCGRPFNVTSIKGCEHLILLCYELSELLFKKDGVLLTSHNGLVRTLNHMIADAYNHYNLLSEVTSNLVGQSIVSLLKDTLSIQSHDAKLEHNCRYFKKNQLKSFIENNLGEHDLTIERIAEAMQCSVRTLHRVFEDENGSSLSEYIWERRLSRCAEELRNPRNARSITEISHSWGFNSSSHFSKAFKTAFGVSPKLFRESTRFCQQNRAC